MLEIGNSPARIRGIFRIGPAYHARPKDDDFQMSSDHQGEEA
jgi:hypothetical protein